MPQYDAPAYPAPDLKYFLQGSNKNIFEKSVRDKKTRKIVVTHQSDDVRTVNENFPGPS